MVARWFRQRRQRLLTLVAVLASLGAAPVSPATLIEAVKHGDLAAVRALIAKGTDVNAAEADGTTALHWAAHLDNVDAIDALIDARADVRAGNRYGSTPLWLACINGSAGAIERLLKAGADPNTTMPEGDTALMTVARSGNVAALKLLVAHGADVNAKEHWKNQTALMWAAARNDAATVTALIEAGADLQARTKYRPLPAYDNTGRVVRGGVNIDSTHQNGLTAFLFAVRAGALESMRALLVKGANVNDALPDGTSALVLAVGNARYEAAAALLDAGADAKAAGQGWTALHQLIWTRRPNGGDNNPWPVARGNLDGVTLAKRLLAKGADPNARVTKDAQIAYIGRRRLSDIGATPFWLAAETHDLPMMRLLAEHKANPLLPNVTGTSPLMAAAGIGIEMPGENAGSPELAAQAVKLCLELGADATQVDVNGNTALHGAAIWGSNDAVRMLVAAGAKLDVVNKCGWIPWQIAHGVAYDGNLIGINPHTEALLRQLMEERGLWNNPSPGPSCDRSTASP